MSNYHLGINMGHDRSAAVVRDGEIVIAIEQERLDRKKHSVGFLYQTSGDPAFIQVPGECIRYCMDALDMPLLAMETITANMPGEDFAPKILRAKFSGEISHTVREVPSHHLAHAYSAYWPSGFDEAIILVVDATGTTTKSSGLGLQTESYTLYEARGTELCPLHCEQVASHLATLSTLGFVYEYVARKAGFVTSVGTIQYPESGKLMGLAAYGSHQPNWRPWLRKTAGDFSLEMSAYDIFLEVAALEKRHGREGDKPYLRPWLVDLAYKVQQELEEALRHVVDVAVRQTGLRKLCMAGGVALNSVANYRILRDLNLEDIFIFPAAGDNGIAAGCALWAYHQSGGSARPALRIATLGQPYPEETVAAAIEEFSDLIQYEKLSEHEMVKKSAKSLAAGNIIGRYEAGSEYGPRALGHRSILADPTFAEMKAVINSRVKFRESFRPFAPVIPRDRVHEVFVLDIASPFMLLVSEIREEVRSLIPAVVHEDDTGRVQTVDEECNPFFYRLCNAMVEQRGGPPVILNTSFNVAGQPIVETPEEALRTLLNCDLDYLSIGRYWVSKRHEPVRDYAEHLATVPEAVLPHGLRRHDAPATELMEKLDRALFFDETDEGIWTTEELQQLSAEGGKFRETSRLFPQTPFHGPLRTQLSDDIFLILDPLGRSLLCDHRGRVEPREYDLAQVKLIMAAVNGPQHNLEEFRIETKLTHLELRRCIDWARDELVAFGIAGHPEWEVASKQDSPLPEQAAQVTCQPFDDPSFSMRLLLERFNDALGQHGYCEKNILELLGCDSLQGIEPTHLRYYERKQLPQTALGDLVRLFLLRADLPGGRVGELLGEELFEALRRLGVLIPRGKQWASRVDIFCCDGLLFATDHRYMFLAEDQLAEQPVMYIGMDSHGLVQVAPQVQSAATLDLCCGSGIQGIVASRYSHRVVSVDVNPRAVRFTRFNAQLNGVENLSAFTGDLYEPVKGEHFDVILANPPFVPSPHSDYKFRDGGANGERILRRIVEQSATHLSATGRLSIVTDLVDVQRYQEKLDSWCGRETMDHLVLKTAERDALLFCVPHSHAPFGQTFEAYNAALDQWVDNFEQEGLSGVNFGYILSRRSARPHPTYFCRTVNNPATPVHEMIEEFFRMLSILESKQSRDYYVGANPSIRLNTETDISGEQRSVELRVPGNPYFTRYDCTLGIVRLLQEVQEQRPRLGDILTEANRDILRDLILKGILNLTKYSRIGETPEATNDSPGDMAVREYETKTTPTCLSSYLS
ncbi:MAG: carbamoyltransferase C-terminal domain-containing protein [Pirellulales bacterium]